MDWGRVGLMIVLGEVDDGNERARPLPLITLRRLEEPKTSSRGGVLMGERRVWWPLGEGEISSSGVFPGRIGSLLLMVIAGTGGVDAATVGPEGAGILIGDCVFFDSVAATVAGGSLAAGRAEGVAEAEICVNWGSAAPVLNGLKSHDGVNFDAKDPRVDRDGALDAVELSERVECMDNCDDDSFLVMVLAFLVADSSDGSSCCAGTLGLSSIVPMRPAVDRRCDARFSALGRGGIELETF